MNVRVLLCGLTFLSGLASAADADSPLTLPGTQPNEGNLRLEPVSNCRTCHADTASGQREPHASWQSGLMSQAGKNLVFRAALAVAEQDIPGVGVFCLRCHVPSGFLAGRALPSDGAALTDDDLEGVTCAVCHRLIDPRTAEATWQVKRVPPGLGNAMIVLSRRNVMAGPYADDVAVRMRPHPVRPSGFLASGDVRGNAA